MKCKKIKELKVTKKCIISAIANSSELETAADQKSIRRIGQKPLPALKAVAKRKTPEESKTTQKADPNVITEDDLVGVVVLKIEIEGKTEITCGWRDIERVNIYINIYIYIYNIEIQRRIFFVKNNVFTIQGCHRATRYIVPFR